ncbi:MAG: hypothetical protein ACSLFP_16745 [Acidimicrobiales bacterium]
MAIRVAPGAANLLCDYADGFVVQITDASDVDAACAALAASRLEIIALAPAGHDDLDSVVVSNPVVGPEGPLLRVAHLDVSDDVLEEIPPLVVRHLQAAGVTDATVTVPEPGGRLDRLDACPNAVVLRLFPAPAGEGSTLPPSWIDIASEWGLGDLSPGDHVPMRLLAVEFDVKVADAPAVLHQANAAGAWCDVVNGDLDDRLRSASITFGRAPHIALATGGPGCDSQALLARFELLGEVARELAPEVAYACIDLETTFEGVGLGLANTGWRAQGGASPNLVAGRLCDIAVPDVFPLQILGPGHLERLGGPTDDGSPPVGEALAHGRFEVLVGDPADWLPIYDARDDVQEEGWELLQALLLTDEQAAELLDARPATVDGAATASAASPAGTPDGGVDAGGGAGRAAASVGGGSGGGAGLDAEAVTASSPKTSLAGTPDLADITLETLPHGRRGLRLTFLELVSWLAHEPHTDAPASVSPVLATYARWFASALDHQRRQTLKDRARKLIGTNGPPVPARSSRRPGPLGPDDAARAWLAVDWLIRVQAASWLRLAGLTEAAARLESIGPTSNHLDLVRAVDVLGSAIMIAGRRIDLTTHIAASERQDDAFLVEQAAWDAWERASEAAGWVAASEAASVGVPAELAYATDLRVIECARDAARRDELEASRRSIGDTAWATALHAVADDAWTAGWEAAHPAVDALAVLPLRTAQDRATRAAHDRVELDDDERETSVDAAESAAKERLTRAALGRDAWGLDTHPWDSALEAAATVEGGQLWAKAQELTRAAVDEGPWEAGMVAARAAVDDVLHDAPDLVARSVGAAVAREAAGAAARGVALRAAAVSRAQDATEEEATAAAEAALAPTVADLQDAAFALLDVLTHPPR